MRGRQREPGVSTLYLHVGTMKTGTTYLQGRLREHRRDLARDGVLAPSRQLTALRDFFGRRGTLENPMVAGAWDEMISSLRTADSAVGVVSMEYLSTCTPQQAQQVVAEFAPAEVHIVLTVRDLPRVMAAQWQETLQNRAVWTWQDYAEDILQHLSADDSLIASAGTVAGLAGPGAAPASGVAGEGSPADENEDDLADDLAADLDEASGRDGAIDPAAARKSIRRTAAGRFWRQHDVVRIVRDWSAAAGADRVHIVTVPPSGAPFDLLWQRFTSVFGVDGGRYRRRNETVHANTGLDLAAAEFLRRLNERIGSNVSRPVYLRNVKHLLGKVALVGREPALKPTLSPDQHERVSRHSARLIEYLRGLGVDVVGDLNDLMPAPLRSSQATIDQALEAKITAAALDAVVAMIYELDERRGPAADTAADTAAGDDGEARERRRNRRRGRRNKEAGTAGPSDGSGDGRGDGSGDGPGKGSGNGSGDGPGNGSGDGR